ncbi:50S ribosomal protein L3, partial [Striga asiatica]
PKPSRTISLPLTLFPSTFPFFFYYILVGSAFWGTARAVKNFNERRDPATGEYPSPATFHLSLALSSLLGGKSNLFRLVSLLHQHSLVFIMEVVHLSAKEANIIPIKSEDIQISTYECELHLIGLKKVIAQIWQIRTSVNNIRELSVQ